MSRNNHNGNLCSSPLPSDSKPAMHYKCRNATYPRTSIHRLPVTDAQVSWDVEYRGYSPVVFIDECAKGKQWSDPDTRFVIHCMGSVTAL